MASFSASSSDASSSGKLKKLSASPTSRVSTSSSASSRGSDRLNVSRPAIALGIFGSAGIPSDCSVLTNLTETCGVDLPTTAIEAHMAVSLAMVGDEIIVEATDPTVTVSPVGNPLSDCTLAAAIGTVLGQDPLFISTMLLDMIEPELAGLKSWHSESLIHKWQNKISIN